MTPQEQQLLESLADRINSTPAPQKDPRADALIRNRIGTRPDALYILTQTVLIQEMALNQANQRLHDLQTQQQPSGQPTSQPTSFLGRLFGTGSPQAPPPTPAPYYSEPVQYASQPSAGSSFLRSAAATATGVAAGALAFEGIEALLGHHGGWGGGGGGYGAFGGGGEFLAGGPSETIINNYYDSPEEGRERGDRDAFSSASDYDDDNPSSDDAAYDTSGSDFDDNSGSVDV